MIAVDTNIVSALLRGEPVKLPNDELFIPYMVVTEIQAGIAAGNNPSKNMTLFNTFLNNRNITTSPGLKPDLIPFYVQIYSYLKAKDTPISPNDVWIAAECMQLSLSLLTRDKDFSYVPQIALVDAP